MNKPKVGMYIVDSRLGKCYIVAVHAAGTIDVQAANGKQYRITGLMF
jgi:hypothetical protein